MHKRTLSGLAIGLMMVGAFPVTALAGGGGVKGGNDPDCVARVLSAMEYYEDILRRPPCRQTPVQVDCFTEKLRDYGGPIDTAIIDQWLTECNHPTRMFR